MPTIDTIIIRMRITITQSKNIIKTNKDSKNNLQYIEVKEHNLYSNIPTMYTVINNLFITRKIK